MCVWVCVCLFLTPNISFGRNAHGLTTPDSLSSTPRRISTSRKLVPCVMPCWRRKQARRRSARPRHRPSRKRQKRKRPRNELRPSYISIYRSQKYQKSIFVNKTRAEKSLRSVSPNLEKLEYGIDIFKHVILKL